jgi:hypothetical protein
MGTGWVRRPSGQLLYFRMKNVGSESFHRYFKMKRDDQLSYEIATNHHGSEVKNIEIIFVNGESK